MNSKVFTILLTLVDVIMGLYPSETHSEKLNEDLACQNNSEASLLHFKKILPRVCRELRASPCAKDVVTFDAHALKLT